MNPKQFIEECRQKRMTFAAIGKLVGVSRQRIHQIHSGYKSHRIPLFVSNYSLPPNRNYPISTIDISSFNGEKNPITEGSMDKIREYVRMRDKRTCQICGKIWKEGQRRFDVHHLDEEKESTRNCFWDREHMDRMTTLCHKCHLNLDSVKKKMSAAQRK